MRFWNKWRKNKDLRLWGTVTTALEPTPLLISFVAYHLSIGAREMHLYLERSDTTLEELVAGDDRVKITVTDQTYWENAHKGMRPDVIIGRQKHNMRHAFKHSKCQWLLHIDADEFLIDSDKVLGTLADLPEDIFVLSIPNAERVYLQSRPPKDVFDGVFRLPFVRESEKISDADAELFKEIYGAHTGLLHRGLSAYSGYKSFFRLGVGLLPDVHQPAPRADWANNPARIYYPEAALLHFDSFTNAHWAKKMQRLVWRYHAKQNDPSRPGLQPSRTRTISQMLDVLKREGPKGLDHLFNAVQTVDDFQAQKLEAHGKLMRKRFDPRPAIESTWPGLRVDLDEKSFDAALSATHSENPTPTEASTIAGAEK